MRQRATNAAIKTTDDPLDGVDDAVVGEAARLEDAPLAVVEHGERLAERLAAVVGFLVRDHARRDL